MIPKSCRLFGKDHATEQILGAKSRFNLNAFCSRCGLSQLPSTAPQSLERQSKLCHEIAQTHGFRLKELVELADGHLPGLAAHALERAADLVVLECASDLDVQLLDEGLRCFGRRKDTVPFIQFEPEEARLRERWNLGRSKRPRRTRGGDGSEFAFLNILEAVEGAADGHVDRTAQEILHRRSATLVRYGNDVDARLGLEQLHRQVARR